MKISVNLDRHLFGPRGGLRYLWVRVEVPRLLAEHVRSPLDIALVLDRSGSMSGSKLALAKQAAVLAVQMLREDDRCALVAYDDEISRAMRCHPMTADQKRRLLSALQEISARNTTNLFGGWMAGAEEVSETGEGRVRRVLLLTDGLANVGLTEPDGILTHVRQLSLRGVGTSTFGVGLDFDEVLVSGMAEAGNGHFYYMERPEQIPDYLSSELGELLSIVARSARLTVVASAPVGIDNLNGLPLAGASYELGDLSEASVLDLGFALEVPPSVAGTLQFQVRLSWVDAASGAEMRKASTVKASAATEEECLAEKPDREVIQHNAQARAARARTEAVKLNRAGDYDRARELVESETAALRKMGTREAAAEADRLEGVVETVAAAMAPAMSKEMAYDSYMARRSRPPVDRAGRGRKKP